MYLKKFFIGAILYASIEVLWRGRTHWTMAVLGGVVYVILNDINIRIPNASITVKSVFGSGIITVLELICGVILNLKLGLKVWNYENIGYNILGQICPKYTVYWFMLCIVAFILIELRDKLHQSLKNNKQEQTSKVIR